jgi:radical SAM superfamily enzyme with C-terminal helix-hairpin-helix motif
MIEFLYSIKKLSEWDQSEFYLLLKGTNNILKLKNEIEEYYDKNKKYPDNIYQMFEQALLLRKNTINNIHAFIYNIPKTAILYDYLDKITNRYMILISRNTDKMYCYVQNHIKQVGINSDTKYKTLR